MFGRDVVAVFGVVAKEKQNLRPVAIDKILIGIIKKNQVCGVKNE